MEFSLKEKEDIKLMNDFKIKIMIKLKKKKNDFILKNLQHTNYQEKI
jgi:hypothetical protein